MTEKKHNKVTAATKIHRPRTDEKANVFQDKLTQAKTDELENKKKKNEKKKSESQKEIGGRDGLEPTRYGDWEKNGRCVDF